MPPNHLTRLPHTFHEEYKRSPPNEAYFLTTLAFWLRSSVVSVLKSIIAFILAPPGIVYYLIFVTLFSELCLQLGDVMTLLLHYWLVLSGGSLFFFPPWFVEATVIYSSLGGSCLAGFELYWPIYFIRSREMFVT